ncbi:pre-miRNA 5'-monophosphate methyltransferase [Parasteatoda tepidariorum]|uniref:pre-miRNA 5'-monophosphate methyltransferase n=1 Tax=Parasteatoda tepidariorum TaxID=114398 RepID=UPI001C71978B|nr:pre-miRNA 5'-monophosphate methyltransferase [Parasteatoda tepidariorum]
MESNSNNEVKIISSNCNEFEPGAARFGNFINYYTFNSVSKRLQALPSDLPSNIKVDHEPIVCLDIGCNSGDLTVALYSHLATSYPNRQIYMLGIDIDNVLITRCNESNKNEANITYEQIDIMNENALQKLKSYLELHKKSEFDIVTCFSTTMWIHLNNGDDGLNYFLRIVSNLSKHLLIEPQEWKCYRSAVRRMTRLHREKFDVQLLKIRNISEHLILFLSTHCDMYLKECLGETSWGRKLYFFKKS